MPPPDDRDDEERDARRDDDHDDGDGPGATPAPPSPTAPAWGLFFICALLLKTVGQVVQVLLPVAGLSVSPLLCLLLPSGWAAWHRGGLRLSLRLRSVGAGLLALGLLVGLAGFVAGSSLDTLLRLVLRAAMSQTAQPITLPPAPGLGEFIFLVAGATVVGVFCEEALFRGYMLSHFQLRYPPVAAAILVGALFGLIHPDPAGAPARAMLGGLYGWMVLRTGSLWPAVVAHAVHNGAGVALLRFAQAGGSHSPQTSQLTSLGAQAGSLLILLACGTAVLALAVLLILRATRGYEERLEAHKEDMRAQLELPEVSTPLVRSLGLAGIVLLLLLAGGLTYVQAALWPTERINNASLFLRVTGFLLRHAPLSPAERAPLQGELRGLSGRVSTGEADTSYAVWTVEEELLWMATSQRKITDADRRRAVRRLAALDGRRPLRAEVSLPVDSDWTAIPVVLGGGESAVLAAYGRWQPNGAKQPIGPGGLVPPPGSPPVADKEAPVPKAPLPDPACPRGALLLRQADSEARWRCFRGATTLEGAPDGRRYEVRPNVSADPGSPLATGALTLRVLGARP